MHVIERIRLQIKAVWLKVQIRYIEWRMEKNKREARQVERELALAEWREETNEDDR